LESFITSDSERRAGIALTGPATTELKIGFLSLVPVKYQNKTTSTG